MPDESRACGGALRARLSVATLYAWNAFGRSNPDGLGTSCTLMPEQEEGPFYVAGQQVRKDIADGKPSVPLQLRVSFIDSTKCAGIHHDLSGVVHGQGYPYPREGASRRRRRHKVPAAPPKA